MFSQDKTTRDIAKSFIVTDFGSIERYLLSSLQNIDENVMLHSCECLQSLVKGRGGSGSHEEGAQDILIKRSGLQALKVCAMDEMLQIRKASLDILGYVCKNRPEAQVILHEIGVVDMCLDYIKNYPDELIDHEVLIYSLDVIACLVQYSQENSDYVLKKEGLNNFVV